MKIRPLFTAIKCFLLGLLFLAAAALCVNALRDAFLQRKAAAELQALPDHDYITEIRSLRDQEKFGAALALAQYVQNHPDLQGREEAGVLAEQIATARFSYWHKAKKVSSGFMTGNSDSAEALAGAIAADMIVWGDFRDLAMQGYFWTSGKETDSILAVLAGVGLLTEAIDAIDWAPSVFKNFRRMGALTGKFTDDLVALCRKSIKNRRLEEGLVDIFRNLKTLGEALGRERTLEVFKHIDSPSELKAVTKVAGKNPDAAYLTIRNAGPGGGAVIERLGDSGQAVEMMTLAASKGPAGVSWLKPGGSGYQYFAKAKWTSRVLKNIHLGRLDDLMREIAKAFPQLTWLLLGACLLMATFFLALSRRYKQASFLGSAGV